MKYVKCVITQDIRWPFNSIDIDNIFSYKYSKCPLTKGKSYKLIAEDKESGWTYVEDDNGLISGFCSGRFKEDAERMKLLAIMKDLE